MNVGPLYVDLLIKAEAVTWSLSYTVQTMYTYYDAVA